MLIRYFYDEHLAQASYLIGCNATGEALVIDPARDIQPYLDLAAQQGLRITHVTETHIHADFVSGSRELAAATGAQIYLSDEGDADWKYAYAHQPNVTLVHHAECFEVGNIQVEVLHTPGHTPEHISFLITDTAAANRPIGIFTGDFVFVGDVGRPDLLENAAGIAGTKEPGARQMYASVTRLKALPDYLQIWPGHGAGSACGKSLGAIPSTTLGYEKLFNPAFQFDDENAFVAWLLDGQPEPPRYFAQMKKVNKLGPALLADLPAIATSTRADLDAALAAGHTVFDLRPREQFTAAHIPGTVNVPATASDFSTYVGWFVDFEQPAYFILPDDYQRPATFAILRAIGVDHIGGVALPTVITAGPTASLPTITAAELAERLPKNGITVLDVRGASEYHTGHVPGALHIPVGYLPRHLDQIPRDQPVVVHCASGYRSQVASSLLRSHGFTNITNLADPDSVWSRILPLERH